MKKLNLLTCVLTAGILFCGCVDDTKLLESKVTTGEKVSITQETASVAEKTNQVTESILKELIDKNIYCNIHIFNGKLPLKDAETDMDKTSLYQVSDDAFKDYAAFENYIRSVYCQSTADMYLNNYPEEGLQKYKNVDGKLYIDLKYCGEKGYYVNWDKYTVTIDKEDAKNCEFTVKTTVEMPADKPTLEEYTVKGTAVFENGKWVLEKMLY